jgi:uncharacterized protein
MEPVAHSSGSGCVRFLCLALLAAPAPASAQWPFNPSGFLYPKQAEVAGVDHVTLLWGTNERTLQPTGVYTAKGKALRFTSLNVADVRDSRLMPFDFTTVVVEGSSYQFSGEFDNSHVYEEFVRHPDEVVAHGRLRLCREGKLVQEAQVEWTYLPKLRSAMKDPNVPYPSGKTELMLAVKASDLARVRALIAEKADVNAVTGTGETALSSAVVAPRQQAELIRILLAAGADVNLGGAWETPLRAAVRTGDAALVEQLLAAGAAVNLTAGGGAPLMIAANDHNAKLIELLLAAGADVNATTDSGRTALMCEVEAFRTGWGSRDGVRALLHASADVNAKDKAGHTALSIARANRDDETVAILLQAGAKD